MDATIKEIGIILNDAKKLAIQYKKLTGKPLGITSEIAEYEAAIKMNCTLCSARTAGHDLIDFDGKKVQVKGKAIFNNKVQRVAAIAKNTEKKPWDYVLLVLLDENYNVTEIYKASEKEIEDEILRERPRGGQPRRNILVNDFKKIGSLVWQRYNTIVNESLGSVPLPKDFNYKNELSKEIEKKHLLQ